MGYGGHTLHTYTLHIRVHHSTYESIHMQTTDERCGRHILLTIFAVCPSPPPHRAAVHAVEAPVSHHDFHATILHLLGLDHKQLTYRHNGRDFRLTDVHGRVVHDLLV